MPHRTLHFEPFTLTLEDQLCLAAEWTSWRGLLGSRSAYSQEEVSRGTLMQRFCCVFQTESAKCTNLIYLVSLLYFWTLDESLMLCIHTSICGMGEVNGRAWGWMNKGKGNEWRNLLGILRTWRKKPHLPFYFFSQMLFGRLKDKRPLGEAVKNTDSEFRLHDFLAALTWPANLTFCFLPVK